MTRDQREQIDMFPESSETRNVLAAEVLKLKARIETILRLTATDIRACRACGQPIFFVRRNGQEEKLIPFQADGQSHFKTCPNAERFTKRKR